MFRHIDPRTTQTRMTRRRAVSAQGALTTCAATVTVLAALTVPQQASAAPSPEDAGRPAASVPSPPPGTPSPADRSGTRSWTAPDRSKTVAPETLVRTTGRTPVRVVSLRNEDGRPVVRTHVVAPGYAAEAVETAQRDPAVVSVSGDSRVHAVTVDDPHLSLQWALQADAAGGLDLNSTRSHGTGAGVKVAVIDSGVDGRHPDLAGGVLSGAVTAGDGYVEWGGDRDVSTDGHGTHVAGIIAARTDNGQGISSLAPDATILPVRVLDSEGGGWSSDVAEAVVWAVDHGAKVVNLSLAGGTYDSLLDRAVAYATGRGAIVVAAAGNRYQDGNPLTYPANYAGVVGVGALDSAGGHYRAPFSNTGGYVDLTAPGVDILSTVPGAGYRFKSGTSMAAPYVASVAAVLTSAAGGASAAERVHALLTTASDKGTTGRDQAYGYGAVNPLAALRRLGVAPWEGTPPPVVRGGPWVSLTVASSAVYGTRYRASGAVTDSLTGLPVSGAKVRLEVAEGATTWSAPVSADISGRYSFTATMRRTLAVRAVFTGSSTVTPGTTRWRSIAMVPSVSTSLRRGVMRVQVTPRSRGTRLTLVKRSGIRWVVVARTRTDAAGRASFKVRTTGTYRVRVGS